MDIEDYIPPNFIIEFSFPPCYRMLRAKPKSNKLEKTNVINANENLKKLKNNYHGNK
jgi:hypothetical protein